MNCHFNVNFVKNHLRKLETEIDIKIKKFARKKIKKKKREEVINQLLRINQLTVAIIIVNMIK